MVETILAQRPAGDPMLSDVWYDVDQIGSLEPHVRDTLRRNDFRVGVAASAPTRALEALLGLNTSKDRAPAGLDSSADTISAPEAHGTVSGHRYWLRDGAETTIQTSPFYQTCQVMLVNGSERRTREYHQARCVLRVQAQRLQDGWARLIFLPEIHHGEERIRHRAGDFQWKLSHEQEIERFYAQRFELTLNVGEMAVISTDGRDANSLGSRFFQGSAEAAGSESSAGMQRLLIVRLADMGTSRSVFAQ